jgi:phosphoglycerol transferase
VAPSSETAGRPRRPLAGLGAYLGAAGLSLLVLEVVLSLHRADWHVPFAYNRDALFYLMLVKGMVDNGWYLHNEFLGMPWPMDLHDFPLPDTLHFLLIKLGTLLVPDPALIMNVYFVVLFPLTTVTALYVFRQFSISFLLALLGSLLYAFLPFRLESGETHIFLSAYYMVPLVVLVILWVGERSAGAEGSARLTWQSRPGDRPVLWSVVVCVLIGSSGAYYSIFAAYFLLVTGFVLAVRSKQFRPMLLPGLLAAIVFATLVANISPTILYRLEHGRTQTAQRAPGEAEVLGLKIAQLILPVTGHRVPLLKALKARYNANPLINENDGSTLGLIGTVGFFILLGWAGIRAACGPKAPFADANPVLSHLSVMNLAALLLGTIGGFGAVVALIVSPQIRAYNRISVYIAFFSLFAVVLVLDDLAHRIRGSGRRRVAFGMVIVAVAGLGILDQSARWFKPRYARLRSEYRSDAELVRRIEATVTPGAMIFQLPVRRFPEERPTERVADYDLFKGYVHSTQLRWSYGAIRQRMSERWQTSVVHKSPGALLDTLALAGFKGIYIDRFGYEDSAASLEAELADILGERPTVSSNGRLAFFTLAPIEGRLKATFTDAQLAAKREEVLHLP